MTSISFNSNIKAINAFYENNQDQRQGYLKISYEGKDRVLKYVKLEDFKNRGFFEKIKDFFTESYDLNEVVNVVSEIATKHPNENVAKYLPLINKKILHHNQKHSKQYSYIILNDSGAISRFQIQKNQNEIKRLDPFLQDANNLIKRGITRDNVEIFISQIETMLEVCPDEKSQKSMIRDNLEIDSEKFIEVLLEKGMKIEAISNGIKHLYDINPENYKKKEVPLFERKISVKTPQNKKEHSFREKKIERSASLDSTKETKKSDKRRLSSPGAIVTKESTTENKIARLSTRISPPEPLLIPEPVTNGPEVSQAKKEHSFKERKIERRVSLDSTKETKESNQKRFSAPGAIATKERSTENKVARLSTRISSIEVPFELEALVSEPVTNESEKEHPLKERKIERSVSLDFTKKTKKSDQKKLSAPDVMSSKETKRAIEEDIALLRANMRSSKTGIEDIFKYIKELHEQGKSPKEIKNLFNFSKDELAAFSLFLKLPENKMHPFKTIFSIKDSKQTQMDKFLVAVTTDHWDNAMDCFNTLNLQAIEQKCQEFEDIEQYAATLEKIEKFLELSSKLSGAMLFKDSEYTSRQVIKIAATVFFKIKDIQNADQQKITINIGTKKLQTIFYDSEKDAVYILHKQKGIRREGGFKIVKTVTRLRLKNLKVTQEVQLLAKREEDVEKMEEAQKKLVKESLFLKEYGLSGPWFPKTRMVFSYQTKQGVTKEEREKSSKEVERKTIMQPAYSGDLQELEEKLSLNEYLLVARNLINATAELHEKKIIHRDIKRENLLFHKEANQEIDACVLTDFGESFQLLDGATREMKRFYGTPELSAPELLFGKTKLEGTFEDYERLDAFAVGITLYEAIEGYLFWGDSDFERPLSKIRSELKKDSKESLDDLQTKIDNAQGAYKEYLLVVKDLLEFDPKKRITAIEARERIKQIDNL